MSDGTDMGLGTIDNEWPSGRCAWYVEDWSSGEWRPCRNTAHLEKSQEFHGIEKPWAPPIYLCPRHRSRLHEWGRDHRDHRGDLGNKRRALELLEVERERVKAATEEARTSLSQARKVLRELRAQLKSTNATIEEMQSTILSLAQKGQGPVVYVFRRNRDGLIKIGFTTNLLDRLGTHMRNHGAIEMLRVFPGDREAEAALHLRFAAHLADRKEWFHPAPEVLEWVASLRPMKVS